MKGDLGALILDIMIANHAKADELSKNVLGIKDLFLLGFFLSISLSGPLSAATVVSAVIITPLILHNEDADVDPTVERHHFAAFFQDLHGEDRARKAHR